MVASQSMAMIESTRHLADSTRPNHFIELSKVLGSSSVHDIYIQNYPVHCFSISNSAGIDIHHITLNNSAGYAPNERSNGLPASHNSDGASRYSYE
jgi:polygalacturonase